MNIEKYRVDFIAQARREGKDPAKIVKALAIFNQIKETTNDPAKIIEEFERQVVFKNQPWQTPGFFTHRYTRSYPSDFSSIGIIASHEIWNAVNRPEIKGNPPQTNPVWDYPLPDWFHPRMGYHYHEWFMMILELEREHGHQAKKKQHEMQVCALETLSTINAGWQLKDHEKLDKELFVPGARVGVLHYPTSSGSDMWLIHEPSQDKVDEIEEIYQFWSEM